MIAILLPRSRLLTNNRSLTLVSVYLLASSLNQLALKLSGEANELVLSGRLVES